MKRDKTSRGGIKAFPHFLPEETPYPGGVVKLLKMRIKVPVYGVLSLTNFLEVFIMSLSHIRLVSVPQSIRSFFHDHAFWKAMIGLGVLFCFVVSGCLPFDPSQFIQIDPISEAGENKIVSIGTRVTLNGTASSDSEKGTLRYLWEKTSGPEVTIKNATSAEATVMVNEPGTYVFSLTVTNSHGYSGTDTVQIVSKTSSNGQNAPVAEAGANRNVHEGFEVTLDGRASYDLDGTNDIVTYVWTQVSGPQVVIWDANTAAAHFTAPQGLNEPASFTFSLMAVDIENNQGTDDVTITVVPGDPGQPISQQYALTVTTIGKGSATLDPSGGAYDEGQKVQVTATPEEGWVFKNFQITGKSGSILVTQNPTSIDMNEDKLVVATFQAETHTVKATDQTVKTQKNEAVTVTLSGSDSKGNVLTYALSSDPSHGVLVSTQLPKVVYTPNANFVGTDSFKFKVFAGGAEAEGTITIQVEDEEKVTVAAPVFSPGNGATIPTSGLTVKITCATAGAEIRYTTDGIAPTPTTGTVYTGPLPLMEAVTVKALAWKSGMNDSPVVTVFYGKTTDDFGLHSGETKEDKISFAGEMRSYKFWGNAGDTVTILMGTKEYSLDPQIDLQSPDGMITTAWGWDSAVLRGTHLTQTGTYTVICRDHMGTHAGEYGITLIKIPGEPNYSGDKDPDGGILLPDQLVKGTLGTVGDMDAWTFTAKAGDTVTILMGTSDYSLDPQVELYSPDGKLVKEAWNWDAASITALKLDQGGTFLIICRDHSGINSGLFGLSLALTPGN